MNFSLLRHVYLDWHLRVLGYEDPCSSDNDSGCGNNNSGSNNSIHSPDVTLASPPPKPRVVTCQYALQRLHSLPDVRQLEALQARQQQHRAKVGADRTLKLFCHCAGPPLIRALEILANLRRQLDALGPSARATTFLMHQHLVDSLVEVRKCHAIWEVSIGDEAFFKKYTRPRSVRFEYLAYMLHLLYVIANLTFPDDLQEYLEEMRRVLARRDWRDLLVLDSAVTYERSRRRLRPDVLAPLGQYPRRWLLHGQTSVCPFFLHNTSVYGHRLVANEYAMRRKTTEGEPFVHAGLVMI